MRKPTQHYYFETSNYDGLSNLIIGKTNFSKAIHSTSVENLDLLTSGPTPPNPSELISSNKFKNLFNQLNEIYDFILVDTPPVIIVTDAQVFLKVIKDCVLVIDSEKIIKMRYKEQNN